MQMSTAMNLLANFSSSADNHSGAVCAEATARNPLGTSATVFFGLPDAVRFA
jgi:hypothetical protein